MACIQHIILFWVTIMSASAYNYKYHRSFLLQRQDYEVYPEPSYQERVGRPAGNQWNGMNERSMTSRSPAQYVHGDQRRSISTVQETTPRAENGSSRVLNFFSKRSPTITKRRGEIDDSTKDKVVFPGPISRRQFVPEVSEECKKIGICEDVPNYPEELVASIIASVGDKVKFQKDELDEPNTPDIAQRAGTPEDQELCKFEEKIFYPRAAADKNGEWFSVINPKDNPVQGFKVEICDTTQPACADFVVFQRGYKASCVQKYVLRTIIAVDKAGGMTNIPIKVPSCCSCLASLAIR